MHKAFIERSLDGMFEATVAAASVHDIVPRGSMAWRRDTIKRVADFYIALIASLNATDGEMAIMLAVVKNWRSTRIAEGVPLDLSTHYTEGTTWLL